MDIEKKLAQTDLNQFKQEPLKLLVKQLYKYQDFKGIVILDKINKLTYKDSTIKVYIDAMRKYLKDGTRISTTSRIYEIIDELKANHTPILTPSAKEKRVEYKFRKQKLVTPPVPVLVEPPKYIEKIPPQYGVKCENRIILQPTKEMALGYIECYKVIGDGKPVELVTVDLEAVEL